MRIWFWFDRQHTLGPRLGFLRGCSEPGHVWLWLWRFNCGLVLYTLPKLPNFKREIIHHNLRLFLARRGARRARV